MRGMTEAGWRRFQQIYGGERTEPEVRGYPYRCHYCRRRWVLQPGKHTHDCGAIVRVTEVENTIAIKPLMEGEPWNRRAKDA